MTNIHDQYGKRILKMVAGNAFSTSGEGVRVYFGSGSYARLDGVIKNKIVIEIESRVSKQIRGAILDLIMHPFSKKLMVLLPVHMTNPTMALNQCVHILNKFLEKDDFEVILLKGNGNNPNYENDSAKVSRVLSKLGFTKN